MSTEGEYTLKLECDHVTPPSMKVPNPGPPNLCGRRREFVDATRMEALAVARDEGWLISKSRTAYCPEHAADRRASWR